MDLIYDGRVGGGGVFWGVYSLRASWKVGVVGPRPGAAFQDDSKSRIQEKKAAGEADLKGWGREKIRCPAPTHSGRPTTLNE